MSLVDVRPVVPPPGSLTLPLTLPLTAPHDPGRDRFVDRIDPADRARRTLSPDIKEDFTMMEQNKRVTQVLHSPVRRSVYTRTDSPVCRA